MPKAIVTEAVLAGFCEPAGWGQTYPRIQILTIADLLAGQEIKMPPYGTFNQAEKVQEAGVRKPKLIAQ